jgi:hypothetical protein
MDLPADEQVHNGLHYWKYDLTKKSISIEGLMVMDYGVLLKKYGSTAQGVYTIVTKNWLTEMFGSYNFVKESKNYKDSMNEKSLPIDENSDGWI